MSTRESREADAFADRFVDECEANHTEPRDGCPTCAQRESTLTCDACGCEVVRVEREDAVNIRAVVTQPYVIASAGYRRLACKNDDHSDVIDGFGNTVYIRNSDNDGELEGWRVA